MTNPGIGRGEGGISLLEVLVAFVILALSVTVLFRIFTSGATNVVVSQQYVDAMQLAESKLSMTGVTTDLTPVIDSGETDNGYTWTLAVEPFSFYEEAEQEQYPVTAYKVTVQVNWVELGHQRQVQLDSIKLQQNKTTSGRPG